MISSAIEEDAVEVGYLSREPSMPLCGTQPALQVRGSSATNHCHAAPAQPTREYQGDNRRCSFDLDCAFLFVPLDNPFHISGTARWPGPETVGHWERCWWGSLRRRSSCAEPPVGFSTTGCSTGCSGAAAGGAEALTSTRLRACQDGSRSRGRAASACTGSPPRDGDAGGRPTGCAQRLRRLERETSDGRRHAPLPGDAIAALPAAEQRGAIHPPRRPQQ